MATSSHRARISRRCRDTAKPARPSRMANGFRDGDTANFAPKATPGDSCSGAGRRRVAGTFSLVYHKVLVVGGGIAGASTAIMLGRAGHEVTVVERDTQLRSSGSPVDVRGSAPAWVERMGVAEQLREADTGVRRVKFVDENGRTRACAALRRSASADFEVSRNALNEILMAAAVQV